MKKFLINSFVMNIFNVKALKYCVYIIIAFSLLQGFYTEVSSAATVAEGCGSGYVPVAGDCLCETEAFPNRCLDEPRGSNPCSEQGKGYECRKNKQREGFFCNSGADCQCCRPINPTSTSVTDTEGTPAKEAE